MLTTNFSTKPMSATKEAFNIEENPKTFKSEVASFKLYNMIMTKDDAIKILVFAKQQFLLRDKSLLKIDAHERSLTHKFAEYLQIAIEKYFEGEKINVDCEYNRDGKDSKKIYEITNIVGEKVNTDSLISITVYPDIIVHKRGPKGPNHIVIEAKKDPNKTEIKLDREKLIRTRRLYHYNFAVFLEFDTVKESINWEFITERIFGGD